MLNRFINIIAACFVIAAGLAGQETGYGPGYQTMLTGNPALSGAEGDGMMRLSYLNFYPGNGYNLHSIFTSYDSYIPSLHGGAGIWISDDYLGGIVNDIRGGLSYAYFLQAGEELFLNAGLSASVYHRGFNFGNAVLPDQIDAIGGISLPSGETLTARGRTVFDIGTGFLVLYRNIFCGFGLSHLSQPDISSGSTSERLKRKFLLHAAGNIPVNSESNIVLRPTGYVEFQGDYLLTGGGTAVEINNLSFNAIFTGDNSGNMNFQTGFSVRAGKLAVFYAYRINVISGNNFIPFSLLHQTGLAFVLNSVEKRNNMRTISLPKM